MTTHVAIVPQPSTMTVAAVQIQTALAAPMLTVPQMQTMLVVPVTPILNPPVSAVHVPTEVHTQSRTQVPQKKRVTPFSQTREGRGQTAVVITVEKELELADTTDSTTVVARYREVWTRSHNQSARMPARKTFYLLNKDGKDERNFPSFRQLTDFVKIGISRRSRMGIHKAAYHRNAAARSLIVLQKQHGSNNENPTTSATNP